MKNRNGYTLMEAMMVITIIGIVVFIGPQFIIHTTRFLQLHTAKIEIQRDARLSLDLINRFLRQAVGSTVAIGQAPGQPPYSRIRFTTFEGQDLIFYQDGTTLYKVAQSTVVISKNLEFIAFTYPRSDDPTIISVAMTMSKATYQGGSKALELSIEKVRIMN